MKVHVAINDPQQPSEPRKAPPEARSATEVVILVDVFRSSATIVEALDNGAKFVVPCSSPDEARRMQNHYRARNQDPLLSGERLGATPEGFDLNISPRDMKESIVKGKAIIYCSTNLTRILADCGSAKTLLIGGFNNAKAVARYLKNNNVNDVVIVACGVLDMISIEDVVGAGAIVEELSSEDLTDGAKLALLAYRNPQWKDWILNGWVARYLRKIGFGDDLPYCIRRDNSDTVPVFVEGRLVPITC